jgi:hypothetical protein
MKWVNDKTDEMRIEMVVEWWSECSLIEVD